MTEQQQKARFRQAIDHTLSGIQGDPFLAQRLLARAAKGEKTMKHHIPKGVVIALIVLLCMSTVAAAVTLLTYSPEVKAQKMAMEALQAKYGLTRSSFGLFTVECSEDEDGTHVWYRANVYLPVERVGDYHVLLVDGKAEAWWTHDDKDPALWKGGSPESPYWGDKQLQAYLNAPNPGEWLQPYLTPAQDDMALPSFYDTLDFTVVQKEETDMSFREAQALADAALMDVYGMTAEEVARYDHYLDGRILLCADGQRLWEITIADYAGAYTVLLDVRTGEIVHVMLTTGGNG